MWSRAEARPDAFRPGLARSLTNLAVYLGNLGRPQHALTAIREATGIYRELAAKWPDAYLQELEQSLRVGAWLDALTALAAAHKGELRMPAAARSGHHDLAT